MFNKALYIIISMVLLSSSAYAMSADDFLRIHETRLQELCEDNQINASELDNPFRNLFDLPGRFECGLTQYYALHKVIDLLVTIDRESEDWKVFYKIMNENFIEEYETFDFMNIHLEYLAYLEEKNG